MVSHGNCVMCSSTIFFRMPIPCLPIGCSTYYPFSHVWSITHQCASKLEAALPLWEGALLMHWLPPTVSSPVTLMHESHVSRSLPANLLGSVLLFETAGQPLLLLLFHLCKFAVKVKQENADGNAQALIHRSSIQKVINNTSTVQN
jgi:hypothetical protein